MLLKQWASDFLMFSVIIMRGLQRGRDSNADAFSVGTETSARLIVSASIRFPVYTLSPDESGLLQPLEQINILIT